CRPCQRSTLLPYTTLFRSGGRGRSIGRGLDVDYEAGRSAELEHAEAGSRFETDPITDHAFEVADVRDFPDFGKAGLEVAREAAEDRKSTRLNSSHQIISYA